MPRVHRADQALRLVADVSRQHYICRTCRAHQTRQFHSSQTPRAPRPSREKPFLETLKESIFGKSEGSTTLETDTAARRKDSAAKHDHSEELVTRIASDRPGVFTVAAVYDPTVTKGYELATTWDELQSIGSDKWMRRKSDEGKAYKGFGKEPPRNLDNNRLLAALRNVAIEAVILRTAGSDVDEICSPRRGKSNTLYEMGEARVDMTNEGNPVVVADGKTTNTILEKILSYKKTKPTHGDGASSKPSDQSTGSESRIGQGDRTWMQVRLEDLKTTSALAKRILQLTGCRVPDPIISNAVTMEDIYNGLKLKERPRQLAKTEELQRLRVELPNVTVHARRQHIMHKEKSIGRWKLIAAELEARDLPLFGNRLKHAKTEYVPAPSRRQRRLNRSPASNA